MKHIQITFRRMAVAFAVVLLFFACGKDTLILTAIPNDPSYGTVSGGGEYKKGDKATVTASPYSGYRFVNWSDGMTENPHTVIMHENTSLTAVFDKVQNYTITVTSNNSGWGSVSGGGTYPSGATATIKATPYSGYSFVKWNDGNTNATRTITVTGNATYTATFKSNTTNYTISVYTNNASWGTVSGGGTYPSGTTVTLKATPYSGYSFDRWDDGNTNATRYITVTGNASYTAYFKSNGGSGTASLSVNFGGTTWTTTNFIGTYWTSTGSFVIGGWSSSNYPWFRMQLKGISTGTYYATLDTTQSSYWLNNNVNIVQYYENTSLVFGDDTYEYGDWQGWNLTLTITSLTSNSISFTLSGYMYSMLQATCSGCDGYVGNYAGSARRYITVQGTNIPFTSQSKGSPSLKEGDVIKLINQGIESAPQR